MALSSTVLRKTLIAAAASMALVAVAGSQAWAHDESSPLGREIMQRQEADREPTHDNPAITGSAVNCSNGSAAGYECDNVDLLSVLPMSSLGGGQGNDIWGWTDPATGNEYAIMGRTNGTAFVDISNPTSPRYLGNLPTHSYNATWRDMKVYKNHAYIVADVSSHGMQVFDLTRLRSISSPQTFQADAHYGRFGNSHNIAINEETGYAYAVGSNTCSGGPHVINIQNPKSPTAAGCVSQDGYTHDTQCVVYQGPDAGYRGRELCVNSNEDTVTLVDVTNKSNPQQIARKGYSGSGYTHQGWLTEDHRYFLLDDEWDEQRQGGGTKTIIFDVTDLDNPVHTGKFTSAVSATDHNQYVKGDYSYQANYRAGLRVLDVSKVGNAQLSEVAYFDVYPGSNASNYNGAWSNYPYFDSGVVIVSSIERGLFVLKPNVDSEPPGQVISSDDFETASGWTVDPNATDGATTGGWERANPEGTSHNGAAMQLGEPTSGSYGLVTGPQAGSGVGSYDIDGGVTSVRSPSISLPSDATLTLNFSYYLAHLNNASSADFFRVQVVTGGGTNKVFEKLGNSSTVAAAWQTANVDLSAYAGQTVRIQIEAADDGSGSLVEAGVDDVRITKR